MKKAKKRTRSAARKKKARKRTPRRRTSANLGICYWDANCTNRVSAQHVTKAQCRTSGGGSWKSDATGACEVV